MPTMHTISTVNGFVHTVSNIKDARAMASTASRMYGVRVAIRDFMTCQTVAAYEHGHEVDRYAV